MGDADTVELLSGLNPVQREAVSAPAEIPLLVVAGAGSGKTRVLTHRVAWLITEHKASPFAVLAITFTNKAAGEMKERVSTLVGSVAQRMWVSTFHSACARILRREHTHLGVPSHFSIYDEGDTERAIAIVEKQMNIDPKRYPPRAVAAVIGRACGPVESLIGGDELVLERRDLRRQPARRKPLGIEVQVAPHVVDEPDRVGLVVDRK